MATIANLRVILDLQDNAFQRGIQNSRDKFDSWGKSLRDVGGKMTAGITAPLAVASGAMVNWASELEQSIGATEQLWGDNAAAILAWSETTSTSLGMSQADTLTSMNRYNAMLKDLEDGTGNVADMSQYLTERSADLAAMWGGTSIEASDSLTSALRGNYEGLDKYNINLTEAMVSQEAMNVAIADGRDEVTEADKVQARYNLIMEQSANAQGQFARETNTTAGKLAIMRARVTNLATQFGRLLLPYVNRGVDLFGKLVDWLEKTDSTTRKWIIGIAAAAAAMGPLLIVLGMLLPGLSALLAVIGFLVSPIGLVVIAIAALVAGLIYAYTHFEGFREVVDTVASAIKNFVTGALDLLIAGWNTLKDAFDAGGWSAVWGVLLSGLQAFADDMLVRLGELSARVLAWVQGLIDNFLGWGAEMLLAGAAWIQNLWDGAVGKWNEFTGWLGGLASSAASWIGDTAASLWQKGADFIQGLWDGATGKWTEFTTWISGLFTGAAEWIGDTLSTLWQKGVDLITGLINGALVMWLSFTTWLTTLPGLIATTVGDFLLALYQKGVDLITGLWNGALAIWVTVSFWFVNLATMIANAVGDVLMTLYQKGADLLQGLWDGAVATWATVSFWFVNLATMIFNAVGDTARTLWDRGTALIQGLWDGAVNLWGTMSLWVQNLPTMIFNAMGDVSRTLWSKGIDLMAGMLQGIVEMWASVYNWLTGLPGLVAGAVGDMAGALVGAGEAVMDGLLSGLQSGWNEVTGWLSGLNPADWKGPEQRDKKMLYGPGIWIMEGLARGLDEGWDDVTRQLRGYTPTISGRTSVSMPHLGEGAGGGVHHHHYYSVTPNDLKQLIENANAGGTFARKFGGELAMMGGQP